MKIPKIFKKRKNEILDACEKRYRTQGFYGVNIKEINSSTMESKLVEGLYISGEIITICALFPILSFSFVT